MSLILIYAILWKMEMQQKKANWVTFPQSLHSLWRVLLLLVVFSCFHRRTIIISDPLLSLKLSNSSLFWIYLWIFYQNANLCWYFDAVGKRVWTTLCSSSLLFFCYFKLQFVMKSISVQHTHTHTFQLFSHSDPVR